ncbi:hypothetical protein BS47DRAFT_1362543 [Hydnum rufescens UP504]|uniref:Uncharacterized protein n=1 Tax=Hydnum rufescens UP504 TaxID=1448309 RepID=A0A9P6DSK9_9AGAM|nr:hypothetical protein BS47DRAFT_1362543 [Hydnum rufescens UP504]
MNMTHQTPSAKQNPPQDETRNGTHNRRPQKTPDRTTHPPKWVCGNLKVPSLHENPPGKHTDEPPVCTATQAQSACPPNMTTNKIAYHTPTAAVRKPHTNKGCAQPPTTHDHSAKNKYHTPAEAVCHLDPTPMTPPNEHRRMMTHPPNESHERQQVETTMQAPDETHTHQSGCGILLNPHPPTKAMTLLSENTQPQYHMPAQAVNNNKTGD